MDTALEENDQTVKNRKAAKRTDTVEKAINSGIKTTNWSSMFNVEELLTEAQEEEEVLLVILRQTEKWSALRSEMERNKIELTEDEILKKQNS